MLSRFDPLSKKATPVEGIANAEGAFLDNNTLWVGTGDGTNLYRVNADTGRVDERLSVPGISGYDSLAVGGGSVWASTFDGEVLRIDVE